MATLEELALTATVINLTETFVFLRKFSKEQIGIIKSPYPTINGLEIKFLKRNRCFQFSTGSLLACEAPVRFQHIGYGFLKPFEIYTKEGIYLVKYGIGKLTNNIGKDFSNNGELWELESKLEPELGYFRAVLPIKKFAKVPLDIILGQHFKVLESLQESLRVAGLITIKLEPYVVNLFDYYFENKRCIFIDCKELIGYSTFEKIIEAIIYSFGFLSGSLTRDELTILKFKNSDFTTIEGFQFRKVEDSIISSLEILNPKEHKQYEKLGNTEYLSEIVFSKIVLLCFSEQRFLRALRIITQARNLPVEIQAASIFVALETIKEIIIEANQEKTASFKNEKFAVKLIEEIKGKIEAIPELEFNNKSRVLRKVSELNAIGNNEGFYAAFELLGISLNKEEKYCISMRNRFLHGNVPFANEPEQKRKKALQEISINAHFLTCALILKYVNYNGAIKDFAKYLDLINNENKLDRPLFKRI